MKQYDIGIDLGTTSIIIATEEQGVVFRQPTIGAVDTRTNSILAVGDEALKMVGRAPAHIDLVRPLRDGIIQDHRMTNELIVRFVNQVCRSRIFKPRIAVCVPAAITGIEADAVVESVMAAGARQVYLVDEPVAAALGAGLQIRQPHGCMVVDIGGGSTDIAVISMGGRVKAASLPVAGNAFDSCIAQYVQEKYQIAIGPLTAEQLKKQVACCTRSEFEGVMEVRGHSWETNLPARRIIYTRAGAGRPYCQRSPQRAGKHPTRAGGGCVRHRHFADRRRLAAARAGRVYRGRAAHRCGHRPRPAELRGPRHGHQPERGQVSERRIPGCHAEGVE